MQKTQNVKQPMAKVNFCKEAKMHFYSTEKKNPIHTHTHERRRKAHKTTNKYTLLVACINGFIKVLSNTISSFYAENYSWHFYVQRTTNMTIRMVFNQKFTWKEADECGKVLTIQKHSLQFCVSSFSIQIKETRTERDLPELRKETHTHTHTHTYIVHTHTWHTTTERIVHPQKYLMYTRLSRSVSTATPVKSKTCLWFSVCFFFPFISYENIYALCFDVCNQTHETFYRYDEEHIWCYLSCYFSSFLFFYFYFIGGMRL